MSDKIYPCLWFDGNGKEAAEFYCSIFPQSEIINSTPMATIYRIDEDLRMHLDAGPEFTFNEAISFVVRCEDQEEIDYYWDRLTEGGKEGKCGWLTDRYGVSWQIVPEVLSKLMSDPEKAPKAMYAFMQMKKLIISDLITATES